MSGSGKKSAKFDKYENKSEIMQYKPAADSSIPSKRKKLDEDDEEEEVGSKVCHLFGYQYKLFSSARL